MTNQVLKKKALASLKGKWAYAILIMLIYGALLSLLTGTSAGIAVLILGGPLTVGLIIAFIGGSQKGKYDVASMFDGFRTAVGDRMLLGLVKELFIFLWSLLFIIPGIVKYYSYKAAEYISSQHPEYDFKKCIDESKIVMNGNKGRLLGLQLSFIGWFLISVITCGIGFFWLFPYYQATETEFMIDLLGIKTVIEAEPDK